MLPQNMSTVSAPRNSGEGKEEPKIYEGRSKLLILLQLKNGRHRF